MMARDDAPDLQQEVQRLLGRCLLRLQQYEALIKRLVANHRLAGPICALERIHAQRVEDHATKPLGYQIDILLKSFFTTEDAPCMTINDAELPSELPAFGYQSTLSMSAEDYARTKVELKAMVDSRNDIVHDFAGRFDLQTRDGCAAACDYLKGCGIRIDAQYRRLCAWANGVDVARTVFASAFMNDAEYRTASWWEEAGIVCALREAVAELNVGKCDWTRLDRAIALVLEKHPAQTPDKYGCKSWKQVLSESRAFELRYRADERDGRVAWFRERGAGASARCDLFMADTPDCATQREDVTLARDAAGGRR